MPRVCKQDHVCIDGFRLAVLWVIIQGLEQSGQGIGLLTYVEFI